MPHKTVLSMLGGRGRKETVYSVFLALILWETGGEFMTILFFFGLSSICAQDADQPSNWFHKIFYKAHKSLFLLGYAAPVMN